MDSAIFKLSIGSITLRTPRQPHRRGAVSRAAVEHEQWSDLTRLEVLS